MSRSPSSRQAPSNQTRSITCKRIGMRQHPPRRVRFSYCWIYDPSPVGGVGACLSGDLDAGFFQEAEHEPAEDRHQRQGR